MRRHCSFHLLQIILILCCLVLSTSAFCQSEFKGKVTNESGVPLAGVTVTIKDSKYSSISDSSGNFILSTTFTSGTYIVSCSHKGYKTVEQHFAISEGTNADLLVTMKIDVLNMEEVIVTGNAIYTARKTLGNAVSTINADEVKYAGTSNMSGLMNGRIMGGYVVQNSGDPGGGFSLKLRGVGSVYGSSEPLYLIDGVVMDNGSQNMVNLNLGANTRFQTGNNRLIDINPHDVDRIEVINGAAAAAIYGSRAANGVVQIFTRKGKKGKPEVVFSSSINYNSLGSRIEVNEYPFRFGKAQKPRLDSLGDNRTMIFQTRGKDTTDHPGEGPRSYSGLLDTTRYPVTRYDYQDMIFNPAWGTDQYLSVSGGGDKASYYLSGSYLDNGGIIRGTGFSRYGLKLSSTYQLNDWVKIGAGLMYANSESEEKPTTWLQFSPIGAMSHTDNVYEIDQRDPAGQLMKVEHTWYNPLSSIETHELNVETNRTIANANISLSPWKGFNFSAIFGMDSYSQQGSAYQARVPYTNVSLNLFPDGYVSESKLNYQQWTTDIAASYTTPLGKSFSSATVAGYSGQYLRSEYLAQEGRNLLPFVKTMKAAQNLFNPTDERQSEQTIWGYFLQETIGYKDYFYINLAGRFDGSSAFGSEVGTVFYPKAGITFTLSELGFWKNAKLSSWFNTLHLRASYGKAGNLTGLGAYDRFTAVPPITYYTGGFVPQNRLGNENIRPEVKTEWEGGADMQFFKGRLYGRFSLYHQQIDDMVIPLTWAPSNGYYTKLDNLGSMYNKGFELMTGGYPVKNKNFSWEISLLYNRNQNKVTSLSTGTNYIGFEGVNQGAVVGYPVGSFYASYFARNDDGTLLLKDVNGYLLPQAEKGDPVENQPQRDVKGQPIGTPINKVLGDPNPEYTATLVNELRYKNLRLRIQVDRVAGMEMVNYTHIIRNNIGNGKLAEKELRGELTRGWVAAVGGQITGPVIWEAAVQDASFTKIRELSISYQWNGIKAINGMEFILTGRNLFTITSYDGYDPETNSAGQSIVRGNDVGNYPIPRVIQFSIVTKF